MCLLPGPVTSLGPSPLSLQSVFLFVFGHFCSTALEVCASCFQPLEVCASCSQPLEVCASCSQPWRSVPPVPSPRTRFCARLLNLQSVFEDP